MTDGETHDPDLQARAGATGAEIALTLLSLILLFVLIGPALGDECMGGCSPTTSDRLRARLAAIFLVFSYCGEVALAVRRGGVTAVAVHGVFGAFILFALWIGAPIV
ncbi:hypothetical protein F0U44_04725 [Nocardioides humilatus]|uniref:Uncharacterized protein n=1 Tax=Nocardioides humilatus TaxID=2607660 RepID=A0A5B1LNA4_9ACTN|nr:hypothetical protein [Nocardioides humilatus]KAA1421588.1 hypothetical protein F0U44_04725 [Nocardioides humilatus]